MTTIVCKKFEKGTVFIRYWYCRIFVCCLDDQYLLSCCRNDKLDEEECQQIELIVFCTSRNVAKAAGEFLKDRLVMAADEEVKKASKSKRGKPWSGFLLNGEDVSGCCLVSMQDPATKRSAIESGLGLLFSILLQFTLLSFYLSFLRGGLFKTGLR